MVIDMTFPKHSFLYHEIKYFPVAMILVCLALMPLMGTALSIFCIILCLIDLWLNTKMEHAFITIDETGIRCHQSGKEIWAHGWSDIAVLRKSSRLRRPSIEVITYDKYGKPEPFALPGHYFQLCKAAKGALRQYYIPKDNSLDLN